MDTALQTVVELALATASGEDLSLDDAAGAACTRVGRCKRVEEGRLTQFLRGIVRFFCGLRRYALRGRNTILERHELDAKRSDKEMNFTEFKSCTD